LTGLEDPPNRIARVGVPDTVTAALYFTAIWITSPALNGPAERA
jgi:hypothetical protein